MPWNFHHCLTLVSSELWWLLFFLRKAVKLLKLLFLISSNQMLTVDVNFQYIRHLIETSYAAEIILSLMFDCHARPDALKNILHQPHFGQKLNFFLYLE